MKNFLKSVVDFVFRGETFFFVGIFAFCFLIGSLADSDHQRNEFCYAKNMVVVNTDAGHRCAVPSLLVPIK